MVMPDQNCAHYLVEDMEHVHHGKSMKSLQNHH